jgi:hypothetical protein
MQSHLVEAFDRLEGAKEDATADVRQFRGDIEHEMIAIGEINVGVAPAEKHRPIARSLSAKMMRSGIARGISFGFDDAAGESAGGEFADHDLADKEAGEGHGADGQLRSAKTANQEARRIVTHAEQRLSLEAAQIKS